MTRQNIEGGLFYDCQFEQGMKARFDKLTLTGDYVLSSNSPPIQILNTGGLGRNVDLPAVASSKGLLFCIINTAGAAETLTVRDETAATVATVPGSVGGTTNSRAWFFCDGTTWYSLGVAADN